MLRWKNHIAKVTEATEPQVTGEKITLMHQLVPARIHGMKMSHGHHSTTIVLQKLSR